MINKNISYLLIGFGLGVNSVCLWLKYNGEYVVRKKEKRFFK